MKIELNRQSQIPVVKQIAQAITDRIQSGYFPAGSRLPSIRQLSRSIGVSPVTVIQAYNVLEKKGLITRIQGKGTFVNGKEGRTAEGLSNVGFGPISVEDYIHRSQTFNYYQIKEAINFSFSAVNPELLPTQFLVKRITEEIYKHPEALTKYGEIQGDLELREEMAMYLASQGIRVLSQEILVTNGFQQGLDLVARCFLGPGDVVMTEEPTYSAAIDVFRSRGAMIIPVPVDDEGMRIDRLVALCDTYTPKLIYTVPTFHNPTGTVMSLKRRRELLDIADSVNSLIVEDDPWNEIHFEQPPPRPLKTMDDNGRVIYIKGLSKIIAPGCRIGFIIAAEHVFSRLVIAKTLADLGNPLLTQKAILTVMRSNHLARQLEKLRLALKKRRDATLKVLRDCAPDGVSWVKPRGGFNIWVSCPPWVNTNDILREAEQRGIHFMPGSVCFPGEPEYHHLRISFSYVGEKQLEQGMADLCSLLTAHVSRKPAKGSTPLF